MFSPATVFSLSPLLAWAVLLLAGLLEIGWALGLKSATASSRPATSKACPRRK